MRGFAKILLEQKDSGCADLSKADILGSLDVHDLIKEYCN